MDDRPDSRAYPPTGRNGRAAARNLYYEPTEVPWMVRSRARSMSVILQELGSSLAHQDREMAALRTAVARLNGERDELLAQLRFTSEQANRETLAAGNLRAELLSRTSVPGAKLDFCCAGDGHE